MDQNGVFFLFFCFSVFFVFKGQCFDVINLLDQNSVFAFFFYFLFFKFY